ncbi:hypothetical protein [Amycolatopsis sp. EV170708-02-1]|uniref:hypothetical protein n=1 Tax=Amycolatopsis sp. EV170708-02-1 TaxID=2919322 RepID=UPI001F0BF7D6|nr:hypothetical protein [Amycolatopsis sp. EV170708-02-1]UMP06840.1 hypothetical protein MJQ72_19420 [Amycolatopsis sp. EV170708-02-1]
MSLDGRRWQVLAEINSDGGLIDAADAARRVCDYCLRRSGASDVALSLMTSTRAVHLVASAGPRGGELSRLQFTMGEGPCLDAYDSGQVVPVADLDDAAVARVQHHRE